jgi:hypothetical protein
MSVSKLDFNYVTQKKLNVTVYLTDVIQKITNRTAGFLYVYLYSLPPKWKINREHLMAHFNVGRDSLNRDLKWLNDNKLIRYEQKRYSNGKLGKVGIVVLDGTEFLAATLKSSGADKCTHKTPKYVDNSENVDNFASNRTTEKPQCGETAPINKNNKKYKINKKTKRISCPKSKNEKRVVYRRRQTEVPSIKPWVVENITKSRMIMDSIEAERGNRNVAISYLSQLPRHLMSERMRKKYSIEVENKNILDLGFR